MSVVRGGRKHGGATTAKMAGVQDQAFLSACEKANVQPTSRQYSKWRNEHGAAARAANKSTRKRPE